MPQNARAQMRRGLDAVVAETGFRPVENVDDRFREWTYATIGVGLGCSGDHVGKEQDTECKPCRAAL